MTTGGPGNAPAPGVVDVVTLGESMVTFLPSRPGRLADVPSFERAIGGAESNVACALAAAGHSARWVSRVGADGFGQHLVERIAGHGVDTGAVRTDPDRPTGVYFRTATDRAAGAHEVAYYRAGSAASAMSVRDVDRVAVHAGRVLHLSGITAALSDDCLALMRDLTAPAAARPMVSFDVNHRPGLWTTAGGPRVLLELARGADLVFVGEDEAEDAWGATGGPAAIRELLPEPAVLVVKQGAHGATAFTRERALPLPAPALDAGVVSGEAVASAPALNTDDLAGEAVASAPALDAGAVSGEAVAPALAVGLTAGESAVTAAALDADVVAGAAVSALAVDVTAGDAVVFVPALDVDVVAPVGAGDAFAAGFLSATLRGLPVRDRLRHGHLMAAAALTVPGDLAVPPTRELADALAALDDEEWGRLRLGPGWTQAGPAPEEVPKP